MVKFSNRDATKFYDQLLEHTESSNYRNKIVELIKSLYTFAEMQYDLSTNPVRAFKKFKAKKQKRVFQVYSMQEFEQFISTFSEENDYELSIKVFFTILYWAGVRRGECKALKWNDIDFEMNTIRIDEQFIDKDPIVGRLCTDVKTENSLRIIYADKLTMELLMKLYILRSNINTFSVDSYIFLRRDVSNPFADTMIENRNKMHAKKAGIKRIRVHDFRHSFASLNYALGVDPKTISTQMGHSNLTITLDTYVNIFDDKVKDRVNIINKLRNKNNNEIVYLEKDRFSVLLDEIDVNLPEDPFDRFLFEILFSIAFENENGVQLDFMMPLVSRAAKLIYDFNKVLILRKTQRKKHFSVVRMFALFNLET